MNKQNEICTHKALSFSLQKERNCTIYDNVDQTKWHFAKWNKSHIE